MARPDTLSPIGGHDARGSGKVPAATALSAIVVVTLFGATDLVRFHVAGTSSVFLRDLLIFLFAVALGLSQTRTRISRSAASTLLGVVGFIVAVGLSFLGQNYAANIAPHLVRIATMLVLIVTLVRTRINSAGQQRIYTTFYSGLALYCWISLLLYPLSIGRSGVGAMEGLGGQHFSKFVFVLAALFFLTNWLLTPKARAGRRLTDAANLGLALLCLAMVLQRGALIAFLMGLLVASPWLLKRLPLWKRASLMLLPIVGVVVLFQSEAFLSYAFFGNIGPRQIFDALLDGSFSLDMVRARGRFEIAETLMGNANIMLLGGGPGLAKELLVGHFFEGKEPHNDVLMILVDFGILGLITFVLMMWTVAAAAARSFARNQGAQDLRASVLFLSGLGSMIGFLCYMPLSNVLVYLNYNLILSIILLLSSCSNKVTSGDTAAARCADTVFGPRAASQPALP